MPTRKPKRKPGFPDPVGLFMSTDRGATWTQRAATGGPGTTYSGYCLTIAVDPASPGDGATDILYYGTSSQARSTDAGATFSGLGGLHADTHAWAFFRPPAPASTIAFCGNEEFWQAVRPQREPGHDAKAPAATALEPPEQVRIRTGVGDPHRAIGRLF